jgi:hypothetical protein
MEKLFAWVLENKEWVFSGFGVAVIVGVINLIFKKKENSSKQTIRSGDSSTNVQAGRDVSIGIKKEIE